MTILMTVVNIFLLIIMIITFLLPFLSMLIYRFKPQKKMQKELSESKGSQKDKISHIICAYNEEKIIYKKLTNAISISYPCDFEIIVISDGSEDKTDEEIKRLKHPKIKYFRQSHKGKSEAQNLGVKKSTGNILLFSDANTFFKKDSVIHLYRKLKENYGCVGANILYFKGKNEINVENFYYKVESAFKKLLSEKGKLLSLHGGGYIMKKDLYEPLPSSVLSDLVIPIITLMKNQRVGFEENALAFEPPVPDEFREIIKRRRRIFTRGLYSIFWILNKYKSQIFKKLDILTYLILYKFLRYTIALTFIILLITGLFTLPFYKILFFSGTGTFILLPLLLYKNKRIKKMYYFFWALIFSSFLALIDLMRGKKYLTWNPRGT